MFEDAARFNQPIGIWNVGAVRNMRVMFAAASRFNHPIVNWNVGAITDMSLMFTSELQFKQNLCAWGPKMTAARTDVLENVHGYFFSLYREATVLAGSQTTPLCYRCVYR